MKIGVFDSGIGGQAVAASLQKAFTDATIVTVDDRQHVPYGNREAAQIIALTDSAIQPLLGASCDIIVIACNSATAAAIETLRERYPAQVFIGLEPMIKPAAAVTKSGVIAICATPATLHSERYQSLKVTYGSHVTILEPDCRDWAELIEKNTISQAYVSATIESLCRHGADVIVLACTHYHWIRQEIENVAANRAVILDPSEAIVKRVRTLLEQR